MSLKTTTEFFIRPLGPLYFGPPRSFCAGEAHRGTSLFPPPPSAFQGMVRSQLLRAAGIDFVSEQARIPELVGSPDALPEGWQLEGPFPAVIKQGDYEQELEPWLPAPAFLLESDDGLVPARPLETGGLPWRSSHGSGRQPLLVGRPELPRVKRASGWLSATAMLKLLEGKALVQGFKAHWHAPLPPFVRREVQPGLALERDGEGRAQHGMLYFLDRVRLESQGGFYGRLRAHGSHPDLPPDALQGTLGAAGRKGVPVAFEGAPPLCAHWQALRRGDHLPDAVEENERFWLITCTPVGPPDPWAPVRQGVLPAAVTFETDALLSSRLESHGGLQFRKGRPAPRKNRNLLGAGSAWLFRLRGGDAQARAEALRRLHAVHPLGSARDAAFGYGFTLVGRVDTGESDHG